MCGGNVVEALKLQHGVVNGRLELPLVPHGELGQHGFIVNNRKEAAVA